MCNSARLTAVEAVKLAFAKAAVCVRIPRAVPAAAAHESGDFPAAAAATAALRRGDARAPIGDRSGGGIEGEEAAAVEEEEEGALGVSFAAESQDAALPENPSTGVSGVTGTSPGSLTYSPAPYGPERWRLSAAAAYPSGVAPRFPPTAGPAPPPLLLGCGALATTANRGRPAGGGAEARASPGRPPAAPPPAAAPPALAGDADDDEEELEELWLVLRWMLTMSFGSLRRKWSCL